MSASLVGSEMCIRDSVFRWSGCRGSDCRPAPPPTPPGGRNTSGLAAVSYTHLTLPTICSV
eukprot:2598585-Alexandrium_andersonii.AAC.1